MAGEAPASKDSSPAQLWAHSPGYVEPGAQAQIRFELNKPVAIENGMRFAMREGGKTVGAGAGIVTEVLG